MAGALPGRFDDDPSDVFLPKAIARMPEMIRVPVADLMDTKTLHEHQYSLLNQPSLHSLM